MFNDATRAQIDAARPDASTWLAANAGSGKTRVLTDRVARLLLQGVSPQHILCLTYTTAAASEMQNRLFKRLGEWAMLDDAALRSALADLGIEAALSPPDLRQARTLFALAIEAPGGLKIQTIHSFCAALLRRFPLEAGVSPQFTEIEERAGELLRAEIVDQMAEGPEAMLVRDMAGINSGEDFSKLTQAIAGKRDAFARDVTLAEILTGLGQRPDLTEAGVEKMAFVGGEEALIQRILPHLTAKGGNDGKVASILGRIVGYDYSALPAFEEAFVTKADSKTPFTAKVGTFPTKPTQAVIADDLPALHDFMHRIEAAQEARLALLAAEKTFALHRFARAFLAHYADAKQRRGWLDFDDLILKARALLTDSATAAWVLYRIDGGISHVLVDEAQDTSPRQWDVIKALTAEFHSGDGVNADADRTLFVVGDKKQSIYSFQGADPREFDHKADYFEEKFTGAAKVFQRRSLEYSFRSSSAILRSVDTAFDPQRQVRFNRDSLHKPFKDQLPGRVDLWPLVEESKDGEDDTHWTDPVDRLSARHHHVVLAEQVADRIDELTRGEHYIPDDTKGSDGLIKRRIRPGDFLILVQQRKQLFAEIIRACKARNLPIAGADRLKVGAELAVRDLAALLSFLTSPDDDLSLATALKSPLFAWNEQALFNLAQGRPKGQVLWQRLRVMEDTHPETLAVLNDLRGQVDFLRPYDLIERILTRHRGRAQLLARLGPEAEDGIDAMLAQALSYERTEVPSLTGFIEWLRTDDLEIKRKIDSASDQIRVMTVHGAKGLEAPIVILPDTTARPVRINDQIVMLDDMPVWKPIKAESPDIIRARTDEMQEAQAEERLRLLYVAMTRAEKWLIVAAAGKLSDNDNGWYRILRDTLGHMNAVKTGQSDVLRFEEGDWDGLPVTDIPSPAQNTPMLEPVFEQSLPIYALEMPTLSPSDLGGAKTLGSDGEGDQEAAMAFGTLVHHLLEVLPTLPEEQRQIAAQRIAHSALPAEADRAVAQALQVLQDETLAPLFSPETLAEVPASAEIVGRKLHGVIDRLMIDGPRIRAVDFKSNRVVPASATDCPEGILRQMGAYTLMLRQIYPGKQIEAAVLWTQTRELMVLPEDLVLTALSRSPYLDAPLSHS
ncbi:double-strand break repair helicase AddA [Sulfitobacter sp. JB4-11]|uniref:double-strand break repair helicase AddA n=1 Tax=Sulfitobacter rhodophyticola TaxID=3238304 RepID=UPI003512CB29